jgi:probable addiction module antidote protein
MPRRTKSLKDHLSERLQTPEEMAGFLNTALHEGDLVAFLLALRYVADIQGVGKIAADARLNRENVYRMLSAQGNPTLSSLRKILHVLGMELRVAPEVCHAEVRATKVVATVAAKLQGTNIQNSEADGQPEQLQPIQDKFKGIDHESIVPTDHKPLAA